MCANRGIGIFLIRFAYIGSNEINKIKFIIEKTTPFYGTHLQWIPNKKKVIIL